jgi:hypothetical protein
MATGTAQIMPANPPEFDNPGWDPFGASDTSHHWWNIEGGTVTINAPSNSLTLVWGSPNDNNPRRLTSCRSTLEGTERAR